MSILARSARSNAARFARALSTTRSLAVATNFGMPAMSPTMTEGGIIEWKVKEGDTFSAGDVLLEVETDKATIDVEAADDGIMAKILSKEGAKGIPVNTPIAVLAEIGDDLASLVLPSVDAVAAEAPAKAAPAEAAPVATPTKSTPVAATSAHTGTSANPNQTLLPSVSTLLHQHNISREVALATIPASGPSGRLLKGDVLVHLGQVPAQKVEALTSTISNWAKLDLSNIKLRAPVEAKKADKAAAPVKQGPKQLVERFRVEGSNVLNLVNKASQLALRDTIRLAQEIESVRAQSVRYDAAFEALLAPSRKIKPFESTIALEKSAKSSSPTDIYALLAGTNAPVKAATAAKVASVKVQVVVNPHYANAEAKAQAYLDRLAYYLADGKHLLV